MAEMGMFMLLIIPLPYTWKRGLFTFISESPLIARLQYGLKVSPSDDGRSCADSLPDYLFVYLDPFR
jgi:Bap31/Bap29 transmembrane region